MIDFFRHPYPDELFYSTLCRNQGYLCVSTSEIMEKFFGNRRIIPKFHIPSHLNELYTLLGEKYKPEYLLHNHSVFNYFFPFVQRDDKNKILKKLISNDSGYSPMQLFGYKEASILTTQIKYCPECIKRDLKEKGEPYFHISHNLPGIIVCPECKHPLRQYPVKQNIGKNKLIPIDLSFFDFKPISIPKYYDIHSALSDFAYDLLKIDGDFLSREFFMERYKVLLNNKGFMYSADRVRQKELYDAIRQFYGLNFLSEINCEIKGKPTDWVNRLMYTGEKGNSVQPIHHLLLINFLSKNLKEFIETETTDIIHKEPHRKNYSQVLLTEYKKRLLRAIAQFPNWKRADIKKIYTKEYLYAFYNDRNWFEANMPKPSFNYKSKKKEYSEEADKHYLVLLKMQYSLILGLPECIRITPYTLAKGIGTPNLFDKGKFPLSRAFADSVTESYEDARFRKCQKAIDELLESGISPTHYLIRTKAKISDMERYEAVKERIESYLEMKFEINKLSSLI